MEMILLRISEASASQPSFSISERIKQFHPDPARKLSANLYDIYHCCVYSENCPKREEFHFKNKFEKLVHLTGFIIRNLSRWRVT